MPGDPVFHPTSYSEVNTILALLLSEVRALVGEELLGMYLNGSLSLGAFEPGSSDIDVLVATVDALTDEQVSAPPRHACASAHQWPELCDEAGRVLSPPGCFAPL